MQWLSLHWEILIMLLYQFLLTLYQTQNKMPCLIALLMSIHVLIETTFAIIWDTQRKDIFKLSDSAAASEF